MGFVVINSIDQHFSIILALISDNTSKGRESPSTPCLFHYHLALLQKLYQRRFCLFLYTSRSMERHRTIQDNYKVYIFRIRNILVNELVFHDVV